MPDTPRTMRVGIQTWGTEGDIRPFFALARALTLRGHEVRVAYTSVEGRDFQPLAEACGVRAEDVGSEYFRVRPDLLGKLAAENMANTSPLRQFRRIVEMLMDPVMEPMFVAADAIASGSDVMVGHFLTHCAGTAAMKHRRPYAMVALAPVLPSGAYAPIGMPDLGSVINPILWRLAGGALNGTLLGRVNALRVRAGLEPLSSVLKNVLRDVLMVITAVSPSLLPRPSDWGANAMIPGFLALPEKAEPWQPEPSLRDFLDAGAPPAFLSFGSLMNFGDALAHESVRIFVEAVARADIRGVIQAPPAVIAAAPRSERVCFIERAPHSQLFPMCSTIVHHGGAGTTQSSLLAGRPSVVVPHAADQFYWGDLLLARAVSPKPLKRTKLTAERLAERLREVAARPELRAKAESLGEALRREDGPTRAAEMIEAAMT